MSTRRACCAIAGALALCACGDRGQPQPAAEQTPATALEVRTFTPGTEDSPDPFSQRLPAEAGRTILVPATELFPGLARVDPQVRNPYEGDERAIAAGERHFAAFNCDGCHAPLGGGGMGPPLSDGAWIHGGEPAQIFLSIMHGRPEGMPAWGSMLPARTVWEMVSYIQSLEHIEDYAAARGFDDGPRFRRAREATPFENAREDIPASEREDAAQADDEPPRQ